MELTVEALEAKLVEYRQAAEQHKALADANQGAAQAVEEMLAVLKAPAGKEEPPKK